jgi:hypothetical protein
VITVSQENDLDILRSIQGIKTDFQMHSPISGVTVDFLNRSGREGRDAALADLLSWPSASVVDKEQ